MNGQGHHFILFTRPEPGKAAALIQEQVEEFMTQGGELEWKVYSHDVPADLGALLAVAASGSILRRRSWCGISRSPSRL